MILSKRISWRRLSALCREFGTALAAGIDMRSVLRRAASTGSMYHRDKLAVVRDAVSRGQTVAEALEATNGYFPEIVQNLVSVGERTGQLAEVFSRLAEYYEHLLKLRRTFLLGVIWPGLTLIVAGLAVLVLILAAGWLSNISGEPIDFLGWGLVGTSGAVVYCCFVALFMGSLALAIRSYRQPWFPSSAIVELTMKLPVFGKSIQMMSMTRMSWAMSLAVNAGMNAKEIIQTGIRSTNNPFYGRFESRLCKMIGQGHEIHEALLETNAFPDEFVQSVAIGEQTGRLAESMEHLSTQLQQRSKTATGGLVAVAAFVSWGFVAMLLIMLIFRLFSFYVSTLQSVADF